MNRLTILLAVLCVVIPITTSSVFAGVGTDPSSYMQCDWTRDDYIPLDGIVADWNFLDAMVEGDMLGGLGDFETGIVGGCTYCPTGFGCTCLGTSTITQETSKLYKNNASAKFSVDALASYVGVSYNFTSEPNTAYQISFRYKGNVGAENFYIQLTSAGLYYNFATDTWQAGASSINYVTATNWVTVNLYFVNDAIIRTLNYFSIARSAANETYYFDDVQIRKLKNTGPKSRAGQYTLQVPVTSDMRFGFSPDLLSKPADGPAGSWGTSFDGVDDYVSYPDIGDIFDPCVAGKECKLSVGCKGITDTIAATASGIIGKYTGVLAYSLYRFAGDVYFGISDDGSTGAGHFTNVGLGGGCFIANGFSSSLATYFGLVDGGGLISLYCNNLAPTVITNADAPIFNSNTALLIGAQNGANNFWKGAFDNCTVWNKQLDPIDASKWLNPYFPANNNNRGSYVTTCTQAASHATCSATKCRDGTPNACQAEATGAMAIFGQNTELVPENSYEVVVGDDSNPVFTGHSTLAVNGDGASSVTAYRDETKHGNVAVRLKSSGSTAYSAVSTVCIPATPATAYYAYVSAKQLGGTRSNLYLSIAEYSDGACAVPLAVTYPITGQIDSSFLVRKPVAAITTNGATNSVIIGVINFGAYAAAAPMFTGTASSDILVDAISLKAGTYFTPWVHNPGAGTTTYNVRDYGIRNTLADQTYAGTYPYLTGWCGGMWVYTDWDGTDAPRHDFIYIPPTAGANNLVDILTVGGVMYFYIYDSAGAYKVYLTFLDASNWSASNWKYIEVCTSNTGTLAGHYYNVSNSTWYNFGNGGGLGTGIQNGQITNLYVGSNIGANPINGFISQLCIKPYNAIYPNCGFNGGKPPFLAATYPPLPI